MREIPNLDTPRLLIRPFKEADLDAASQLFDVDLADAEMGADKLTSRAEREDWLRWSVLNHRQLALLNQPPYGDRAIILKESGALIGSCGYVPALDAFEQLPGWPGISAPTPNAAATTEFALFYAISPRYRSQGYAVEAVSAMIDHAFTHLHLKRIIAETDFDNTGSIAVMKRLGMSVLSNPYGSPVHLQVVGVLEQSQWDSTNPYRDLPLRKDNIVMKSTLATTEEYIAQFPPEIQVKLQELRAAIRAAAPEAKEKISYGMPAFAQNGPLVYFAAFKNHLSFFPAGGVRAVFGSELDKFPGGKGTVQLSLNEPLPLDLIARIVKYRVNENMEKAKTLKK